MLQLNNRKQYIGSLMAPIDLTLSDLERSLSRSFRYWMIEERYSVNIYFLVVFDINLDVTLCSLLEGGVLRCTSGLSYFHKLESIIKPGTRPMLRMAGFFTFTLCVCLSVCLCARYVEKYQTDQLHFWWRASLWHKEETVRFWKKLPRAKSGPDGGGGVRNCSLMIRDRRKLF